MTKIATIMECKGCRNPVYIPFGQTVNCEKCGMECSC